MGSILVWKVISKGQRMRKARNVIRSQWNLHRDWGKYNETDMYFNDVCELKKVNSITWQCCKEMN